MERYSEYKDSGVQWLGEIPGHWGLIKMKYLFNERSEKNHPDEEPLCATQKYGVIPQKLYISYGNRVVVVNKGFEQLKFVKVGDFVIHLRSFQGGIEYAYYQGISSAAYTILYPKDEANTQYFKHLFKSSKYIELLKTCVTGIREGQNINYPLLGTKQIPLPPLSEQHTIVSFLDDKCAKIDKMLEGKQKQIELLAEMKQRIIADAVTRGLNPDVELKESGIFWIRHVPSHWNVRRLGHVLRKENRERPINAELLVCTNKAKVIKRGESKMGLIADSEDVYQGVKKGDLLIHGMDTWHGAIAISEYDGMCTPVVHVCTSNEDVGFISLYLRYMAMMKVFKLISNGVRQNTSDFRSWGKVAVIPCPLPPLDEQHAIVSYITDKTSKIDALTSKLQQEIESIKEYKQRLISDVVTGQIKVC